jgi:hypothetical protein
MLYRPDHPLVHNSPYIPEHRVILWERIGPGSHPCYHCGTLVSWRPGERTKRGALVSDHLDRDKTNNGPDNLVPSCTACNTRNRAYTVRDDEPFITRPNGTRLRGEWRVCRHCGERFVSQPGRPGRFCSKRCTLNANRARKSALVLDGVSAGEHQG